LALSLLFSADELVITEEEEETEQSEIGCKMIFSNDFGLEGFNYF
jgi:hypothetical protein